MLEHVTVLSFPTFLSANAPVALAVTVSPLTTPLNVTVHVAVVFPSYVLLLALTLGVKLFAVIFALPVKLVVVKL